MKPLAGYFSTSLRSRSRIGGGRGALARPDDVDVGVGIEAGGGHLGPGDDDAGRRHVGDTDRLALEVGVARCRRSWP